MDSQLRAQFRSRTGFPFQLHSQDRPAITMIAAKIYKISIRNMLFLLYLDINCKFARLQLQLSISDHVYLSSQKTLCWYGRRKRDYHAFTLPSQTEIDEAFADEQLENSFCLRSMLSV